MATVDISCCDQGYSVESHVGDEGSWTCSRCGCVHCWRNVGYRIEIWCREPCQRHMWGTKYKYG